MPPAGKGKRKKAVAFSGQDEVREIPRKRGRSDRMDVGPGFDSDDDEPALNFPHAGEEDSDDDLEDSDARKHMGQDDDSDDETGTSKKYELTDEDLHEDLDTEFTDGGVEVTPFNLKEEMEEGSFDAFGNYSEDKDAHAGDEWLEGVSVYKRSKRQIPKEDAMDEEEETEDKDAKKSDDELVKELSGLLQPRETVTRALQRLGGKRQSSAARWSSKNKKAEPTTGEQTEEEKRAFERLTAITDQLLSRGRFDVYQDTYEKLAHEVKTAEQRAANERQQAAEDDDGAKFEFKWEDSEAAQVYGPFSARQMLQWQEQNYFGDKGVMVRELDKPGSTFYNSTRIDFDLYT